jgi:hypothetical protein
VTLVLTRLHGCGPHLSQKEKQIPTPSYAYPPSPKAAWPLIRLPPFPPCTVGLLCYAHPLSPATLCALAPYAAHLRPNHLRCSPTSQSPALLTYILLAIKASLGSRGSLSVSLPLLRPKSTPCYGVGSRGGEKGCQGMAVLGGTWLADP